MSKSVEILTSVFSVGSLGRQYEHRDDQKRGDFAKTERLQGSYLPAVVRLFFCSEPGNRPNENISQIRGLFRF